MSVAFHSDHWKIIVSHLDPLTRQTIALLNSKLLKIAREKIQVVRLPKEISDDDLSHFKRHFPSKVIQIIWSWVTCDRASQFLQFLIDQNLHLTIKRLTFHILTGTPAQELLLLFALGKIPSLEVLEITKSSITGRCIPSYSSIKSIILNQCAGLQSIRLPLTTVHLDISYCKNLKKIIEPVPHIQLLRAEGSPLIRFSPNPEVYIMNDLEDLTKGPKLLEKFANPNTASESGFSVLHFIAMNSVFHRDEEMKYVNYGQLLIEKGADPKALDGHGDTPFHCSFACCPQPHFAFARMLLEKRMFHVDKILTLENKTVLYSAVHSLCYEGVRLLIQYGANPNHKDSSGENTLHDTWQNYKMLRLLLQNGADPNIPFANGNTLLVSALWMKKCKIRDTLVKYGAKWPWPYRIPLLWRTFPFLIGLLRLFRLLYGRLKQHTMHH